MTNSRSCFLQWNKQVSTLEAAGCRHDASEWLQPPTRDPPHSESSSTSDSITDLFHFRTAAPLHLSLCQGRFGRQSETRHAWMAAQDSRGLFHPGRTWLRRSSAAASASEWASTRWNPQKKKNSEIRSNRGNLNRKNAQL